MAAPQRKLIPSKAFVKAYKKFTSRDNALQSAIAKALQKLEYDAFDPSLKTHKLSGKLAAYLACSCGYDCKIIFVINETDVGETILLFDIGTHDDVY